MGNFWADIGISLLLHYYYFLINNIFYYCLFGDIDILSCNVQTAVDS